MTGFVAVFRREWRSLWVTPLAWSLFVVFLFMQGVSFAAVVRELALQPAPSWDAGPVQRYFGQSILLTLTLLLLCPALAMRAVAEERRSGTLETLLTAPVTAAAVVYGKFLALLATYAVLWIPVALALLCLGSVTWQQPGVLAGAFLGVLLLGAALLALGLLMSTIAKSQLVALLATLAIAFLWFLLGWGAELFPSGVARAICEHTSMFAILDELSRGIVELRRLVFLGSMCVVPLFVATRVVDSWRWG